MAIGSYFSQVKGFLRSGVGYVKDNALDVAQTGLDVVGLIPVVGELADATNAGIYIARGDYLNAGFSMLSCIPVVGDIIGKGGKYAMKLGGKGAAELIAQISKMGGIDAVLGQLDNIASKVGIPKDALNKIKSELKDWYNDLVKQVDPDAAAKAAKRDGKVSKSGGSESAGEAVGGTTGGGKLSGKGASDGKPTGDGAPGGGASKPTGDRTPDGGGGSKSSDSTSDTPNKKGKSEGEPVDVATGCAFIEENDLELPSGIPLVIGRAWYSSSSYIGPLGHGWHHSLDILLKVEKDYVSMRMSDGRIARFSIFSNGDYANDEINQLSLSVDGRDFIVTNIQNHRYRFVSDGGYRYRIESIADTDGNLVRFEYDGLGLHRLTDAAGRKLEFRRDVQGRFLELTGPHPLDPGSRLLLLSYEYSSDGDLIRVTDAEGASLTYAYQDHLMVRATDQNGLSWYHEYEFLRGQSRCTKTWGDNNYLYRELEYDFNLQQTTVTTLQGLKRLYEWNDSGIVLREVDPYGNEKHFEYDEFDRKRSEKDAFGQVTRYTYDLNGNQCQLVMPDGALTQIAYSQTNKPVLVHQADGSSWHYLYDERDHLVQIVNPVGGITLYEYNELGKVVSVTDALGHKTEFNWNLAGELLEERLPNGAKISYQYDSLGRLTQVDEPNGQTSYYEYDFIGRLIAAVNAEGGRTELEYNSRGDVVSVKDPEGRTTKYEYNNTPFVHSRQNPDGTVFHYEYDTEFNLTKLINENGDQYTLQYDANDNLVCETGFDGRVQQYAYDAVQRLSHYRDVDRITCFERDPLGRLLGKLSPDGEKLSFTYDATGRLKEANNRSRRLAFNYDPLGNLTEERQDDKSINHQYDALGQRIETTLFNGDKIENEYDALGGFTQVRFNGDVLAEIERDLLGQEVKRDTGALSQEFDYDPMGRLKRHTINKEKRAVIRRNYGYDKAGNLTSVDDLTRGRLSFQYDPRDRIRSVHGRTPEQFQFDPAGNFLDSNATRGGYSKGNRLLVYQDRRFSYDEYGNLVKEEYGRGHARRIEYAYNSSSQLISVTKERQTTRYQYDALGRRISKSDGFGSTDFYWSGDTMVYEIRGGLEKSYIYEPYSFRPLVQISNGEIYHYHLDQVGAPQELTDKQGEIAWRVVYRTYGSVVTEETERIENSVRFQGQYFDSESGLHYNRHRYYHPGIGRFTSQDPIGLDGGDHLYEYVPSPTVWVDPLGLVTEKIGNAPKNAPDFIVTPNGSAVHTSQSKMKQSILDSGGKKIGDARGGDGEIFRMDTPHGPMDVRVMDGTSGSGSHSGARSVFTEAGKDKVYVHPSGERIRGNVSKPERRQIGHIHNQVNDR